MSKRCFAAIMLAAIALVGGSCGRSNSAGRAKTASPAEPTATSGIQRHNDGQSSTRSSGRSELIAKADVICAQVSARRAATKIVTTRDYAEKLPALAAYEQAAYGELRKLVPPRSMAADWRRIVADEQLIALYTAKIAQYAKINDFKALTKTYAASTMVRKRLMTGARRAGVGSCATL